MLWKVHGTRGTDPAEPAGSPHYAYPAIPNDPGVDQLKTHLRPRAGSRSPCPWAWTATRAIP